MSKLQWLYGKKLQNSDAITEFEKELNIQFPPEYKKIVSQYDGGTPVPQFFSTADNTEKVFNYLIKASQIQEMFRSLCREFNSDLLLVPFADDPAGNFICFDFTTNKSNPQVVFFDLDVGQSAVVTSDFNAFLNEIH